MVDTQRVGPILRLLLVGAALMASRLPSAGADISPSPWDAYNEGVRAYAAGQYSAAFDCWRDLASQPLPRRLRSAVWFQSGNAQFRLGEPHETDAPEQAVEWWRRALESYRAALERSPRHSATRHNYDLVRRRLARLLHRLGMEALEAAEKLPLDPAIHLLEDGLAKADEAVLWHPEDGSLRVDLERIEAALKERWIERAAGAEAKGDAEAARNTSWGDLEAESKYRAALEDLGAARARADATAQPEDRASAPASPQPAKLDEAAVRGEARVREKLSDLLTRMGRREQKTGDENSKWDTGSAIEPYEAALGHFREALEVRTDHEGARRGQLEVRAALEALHVRLGNTELEEGRDRLARKSPEAAPRLMAALDNFEAARGLNPDNAEANAGAAEARRLLPEALVLAGQRAMAGGEQAEEHRPGEALGHYQDAQTAFEQALELEPGQEPAREGLQEVEPRIARLRERVALEAEQAARQRTPPDGQPSTLEELLGQASERQQEREGEWDRRRQRARKETGTRRGALDW